MSRGDIKLVIDQLNNVEVVHDYDENVTSNAVTLLETLGNKVAEQEKQIQQLQMALADAEALETGTAERCRRWRESHKMSQEKVIEKSAVIEKLHSVLQFYIDNGICEPLYYKAKEALSIPTDSKQILADWMREQLGEPVAWDIRQVEASSHSNAAMKESEKCSTKKP